MRTAGIVLLVLGVGSFLLPLMGLQFRLISVFGDKQWMVGLIVAIGGAAMIGVSMIPNPKSY